MTLDLVFLYFSLFTVFFSLAILYLSHFYTYNKLSVDSKLVLYQKTYMYKNTYSWMTISEIQSPLCIDPHNPNNDSKANHAINSNLSIKAT